MQNHYPEHLLKDYELLLSFFPSHKICRPVLVDVIQSWKATQDTSLIPQILEIGPGFGETTELILKEMPCRMTLVEVDASTGQTLQEKFSDTSVTVVVADALSWIKTQGDASFDIFTASWVIHNFTRDEREKLIPEIYRILKPNGLLVLFDKILPDTVSEVKRYWGIHMERLSGLDALGKTELKNEMLTHELRDTEDSFVWHEGDARTLLERAGFKNIQFHTRNERDVVLSADR